jgi:hypothetical protein
LHRVEDFFRPVAGQFASAERETLDDPAVAVKYDRHRGVGGDVLARR